ncbi:IS607 family transposase ISTko1 [Ktedonobacter sp. SOSP1-85]|uniref:IS607 family transposase n=1 Tax=Ktedonobacter sp. SOSP1-85 TaxID=2778367 RepID=UPI001915385C|nr:IS607 family transposase [Ktedonobacter sp. SOSP1-85]GHO73004.1 IS607 family transposase ISTko1 [Ktedonobacter sp. SOSP1-85]
MEHTYSPKQFGKLIGKSVNTLQKWDRKGILPAFRSPTNRRYYTHEQYLQYRGLISSEQGLVIAYARVSSPSQKKDLALQKEALRAYCLEHGINVDQWIEDIGSALNYKRKGFNQVIEHIELGQVARLIIGYEDRFVRFGYDWFEQFCERHGTQITVVNGEPFSPEEELVRDLMAIVTVFSSQLPGLRSHRNLIRAAALGKDIKDDQDPQDQTASHT